MAWVTKISGKQIKDEAIINDHVNSSAAIVESKLALDYTTQSLYDFAVRTDASRVIAENIVVTFPSTGWRVKDSVNGKTYTATLQNGVLVWTEVV